MRGALLTKHEVAELTGKSLRWVERNRDALKPIAGDVGPNGQPVPLYDVSALPAEWQKMWARSQRQRVVEIAPAPAAAGEASTQLTLALTTPVGPNLSVEDRAEAERRYGVIEPLVNPEKFPLLYAQYPRMSALYEHLAQAHQVKVRTIYRWQSLWSKGGLPALVRRDRSDKGHARVMNDAARALLLKLAVPQKGSYGVLRIREMWRVYEEERIWRAAHVSKPMGDFERDKYAQFLDMEDRLTPAAQLPQVSYETFRVWYNRIPEMIRTMGREGEDAYRVKQGTIIHRDYEPIDPMDWVVMDHRKLDIFCLIRERGGWKLARPWLTAAIDMRTRKWLAWAIVEQPSSDSIATVLKKVFVTYGLPKELYWDNGKDFRCEWFEGKRRQTRQAPRVGELDATWRGVLGTLQIRVRHAIAYNARAKVIEENFNRISNIDRTLPEWCGHQPGARPERFDALVKQHEAWTAGEAAETPFKSIDEITLLYGKAIRDLNERPLEGEGMRKVTPTGHGWKCPNEAWEDLIGQVARRSVPVDVLHMCFAKRKQLTVRNGELTVTHFGRTHYYRLSDNSQRLMKYNGEQVEMAYDPLDMGEAAVYYQNRFLGLVNSVTLRHMGEQDFVQDIRDQRAAAREVRKAVRAMERMAPAPSLEERLNRRAEILPERRDVLRVEIPMELPAPVQEAAAAAEAEKGFQFATASAELGETTAAAEAEGDAFDFFS